MDQGGSSQGVGRPPPRRSAIAANWATDLLAIASQRAISYRSTNLVERAVINVSWTTSTGERASFTSLSAQDALNEMRSRGLYDEPGCKTPGLKITDAGKVKLTTQDLHQLSWQ